MDVVPAKVGICSGSIGFVALLERTRASRWREHIHLLRNPSRPPRLVSCSSFPVQAHVLDLCPEDRRALKSADRDSEARDCGTFLLYVIAIAHRLCSPLPG